MSHRATSLISILAVSALCAAMQPQHAAQPSAPRDPMQTTLWTPTDIKWTAC